MDKYTELRNGVKLPYLGFGTMTQFGDLCSDNVALALNNGYELIDTANRYGNEVEVGKGLKQSGLKREDYLIETKLGPTLYTKEGAVEGTLERLGVDYIDVMIIHHPTVNYMEGYRQLEKAYKEGKIRAIGISNFPAELIDEFMEQVEIKPMIMQCECHPYYPAEAVRETLKKHGIQLQAWFPLGKGTELLKDPVIVEIANKHGKSTSEVVIRWHIQNGFALVPGSKTPAHIIENAKVFDFELDKEDMAKMASLNRHDPIFHQTPEGLARLAAIKCNFEK